MTTFPLLGGAAIQAGGGILSGLFGSDGERPQLPFRLGSTTLATQFGAPINPLLRYTGSLAGFDQPGQLRGFNRAFLEANPNHDPNDPNSLPFQLNQSNISPFSNREQQRALAVSAPGIFADEINSLIPGVEADIERILASSGQAISAFGDDSAAILGELDLAQNRARGVLDTTRTNLASARGAASARADALRQSGAASINRSLRERGFGGSSTREAEIVSNLLPQTIGGELAANASIDQALANLGLQEAGLLGAFGQARAGVGQNLANTRAQLDLNQFNNEASLRLGTLLGLRRAGADAALNVFGQPSAVFADPITQASVASGQQAFVPQSQPNAFNNLGAVLGGLGGQFQTLSLAESLGLFN